MTKCSSFGIVQMLNKTNMTETATATNSIEQQAKLAVFASTELESLHRPDVFQNIGAIALRLAVEVEPDGLPGFSHDDFRHFESQQSPEVRAQVEYRHQLLGQYEPFAEKVEAIKAELHIKAAQEVEGYLAAGNESDVFSIENEGRKYVVRVSKTGAEHIDGYVKGTIKGREIPGLEQLTALSYEQGVTIGEMLPGKGIEQYSTAKIAEIPEEHFRTLADTLIAAAQRGISIDGNDGNLLYDPHDGFGIVDYGDSENGRGVAVGVTDSIFRLGYWLSNERKLPTSEYPEDYEILQGVVGDLAPTFERWVKILAEEQIATGVGDGFLTSMESLVKDSEELRNAQALLQKDGAIEALVVEARLARETRIKAMHARADVAVNDFIRDNILENAAKLERGADRMFPKGNIRVSRNDNR